jgi:hypothetical protein
VQAKTIWVLAAAVLAFVAVAVVDSGSLEAAVAVVDSGSLEAAVVVVAFAAVAFAAFAAFSIAAAVKTAAAVQGSNLLKTEELGREGVALVALVAPGSRDVFLRQIWKQNYSFGYRCT